MRGLTFDIAHMLAGSLVLISFMQLYQDRLLALVNIFALHAIVLTASVAWKPPSNCWAITCECVSGRPGCGWRWLQVALPSRTRSG